MEDAFEEGRFDCAFPAAFPAAFAGTGASEGCAGSSTGASAAFGAVWDALAFGDAALADLAAGLRFAGAAGSCSPGALGA